MALLVGTVLALAVGLMAATVGLDRDRAFYPTVMIAIASLYVLFAAMGASAHVILLEALVAAAFLVASVIGFKSSLWIVAIALAAHGVFDLAHSALIANPGVPVWYRDFCLAYDVAVAAFLAWLLKSGRIQAAASERMPSLTADGGR